MTRYPHDEIIIVDIHTKKGLESYHIVEGFTVKVVW